MACFRYAPMTNIFVDSWASPRCVAERVDNESALNLYKQRREIDIKKTFEERDAAGVTHVKALHLKKNTLTNSAIIVIPAYNVEKWTAKCIRSAIEQTYPDLGIVFIDDYSTDATWKIASEFLAGRQDTIAITNPVRKMAMANFSFAIRECCSNPESVIFNLDGDDWLACPTAIAEMMEQHKTADVVWSKYKPTIGDECICAPLTSENVRKHRWVTSHLRSFKKFLFDAISEDYFKDEDGGYYRYSCDQAIMIPVTEQVPPARRKFYDKVLYIYNRDNPINDDKVEKLVQLRTGWRIQRRNPYGLHSRYKASIQPATQEIKLACQEPVSVIVSSYNQLSALKMCLESLRYQTTPPLEVIVADDGSTDGTLEWIDGQSEYPFGFTYVTRRHEGYRLASLQNLGARTAKGKRLLFTNADVVHCPGSIAAHSVLPNNVLGAGVIKSIDEAGTPLVTPEVIADFGKVISLANDYFYDRTNLKWKDQDLNQIVIAVWGGNFSVSVDAFSKIGGFDEEYVGWGGEDANLAARCRDKAGCQISWVKESEVFHLGHPVRTYSRRQLGSLKYASK